MSGYIVELRDNRAGSEDSDAPSAYLGTVERDGEERVAAVVNRTSATIYRNEAAARCDLNRQSDAFYERYWPLIVKHEGKSNE